MSGVIDKFRDITQAEWDEYEWIEVSEMGEKFFIRGLKRTQPPQDGFVYVDDTRLGDSERKWRRAKTIAWSLV